MSVHKAAVVCTQLSGRGGFGSSTHLQGLLVHLLCHAAQVANDVAGFTQVELQQHRKKQSESQPALVHSCMLPCRQHDCHVT